MSGSRALHPLGVRVVVTDLNKARVDFFFRFLFVFFVFESECMYINKLKFSPSFSIFFPFLC